MSLPIGLSPSSLQADNRKTNAKRIESNLTVFTFFIVFLLIIYFKGKSVYAEYTSALSLGGSDSIRA